MFSSIVSKFKESPIYLRIVPWILFGTQSNCSADILLFIFFLGSFNNSSREFLQKFLLYLASFQELLQHFCLKILLRTPPEIVPGSLPGFPTENPSWIPLKMFSEIPSKTSPVILFEITLGLSSGIISNFFFMDFCLGATSEISYHRHQLSKTFLRNSPNNSSRGSS